MTRNLDLKNRKILCLCPCCRKLVRVSDLKLKVKGSKVNTWLDEHERKQQLLEKKVESFGEKEAKLREKAVEMGRKEAQRVFHNAISPEFKALKVDPFDLKPIFNPVDFIAFNGMNKSEAIDNITLLWKKEDVPILNSLRLQIKDIIAHKKFEWKVARIDERGGIVYE